MKMFVGLVLFAAFALPAAFAARQDVITLQAYEKLLKNGAAYGTTKTVISNPVLEEALFSYSKDKLSSLSGPCGETCQFSRSCDTPGCYCQYYPVPLSSRCFYNSLESTKHFALEQNSNKVGEEAVVDFARKGLAAALAGLAN